MKITSASFVTSAVRPSQYPDPELPEIAFAGRSNVGKSTLLNKLLNRKALARTGSTPGRTQAINFFLINNSFYFTDLPGYGYAKVPARVQKKWGPMVGEYLKRRDLLKALIVILDIRRTPSEHDLQLLSWLNYYNISARVVLNKADKLTANKQRQQAARIAKIIGTTSENPVIFSSKSGLGRDLLWAKIEARIQGGESRHLT